MSISILAAKPIHQFLETYSEPSQTPIAKIVHDFFWQEAPSQMFDLVMDAPLIPSENVADQRIP